MSASRLVTLGVLIPLSAASLWLSAGYAEVLGPNFARFMPHGYCYMWDPRIVWLHVISDGLIAAAYYCIPIILIYFIGKNRSQPLNKIFWMFAAFILACGTTHVMEIWNIWHATYFAAGVIKALTAAVSMVTAAMLIPLVPKAMLLPNLVRSQQQELAHRLQAEVSAQLSLEEQTQKLQSVLESMTEGLVAVDAEGKIVLWNAGASKLLGLEAAAIAAHAWAEHYGFFMNDTVTPYPADQTPLLRALRGEATRTEMFVRNEQIPQGAYVEIYGNPMFGKGGAICGGVAAFRDITQLRKDERIIRKLNEDLERRVAERTTQLETVTAEVSDQQFALDQHAIVAMTDVRGTITYVNDKFCTISKYSREELMGQNHRILNSAHHPTEFFQDMYATIARGNVWRAEIRNRAKDGSIYWVDTTIVPTLGAEGKPRQYVAIRADVTERKRAEEDLAKLHQELEARNLKLEEQTVELQRTRDELESRVITRTQDLAKANETLESSNIELQQFAYVASHDLQSPLRSISGFVQLLKMDYEEQLDDQARDYIRRTVQSIAQMQTLIRDLLSYSRVESRSRPFVAVPLADVVHGSVSLLESSIRDAAGQVTCGDLPAVLGDSSQLAQLMQNLIGNGLKYHGTEPPHVHVSAEPGIKKNEWIVSVRDNGIGIDPKYFGRIFEIFKRLHDQKEYPGTGIGLAVCRRVVERHGGTIWVESEPGHGSNFRFTIPAGAVKSMAETERTDEINDQQTYQHEAG